MAISAHEIKVDDTDLIITQLPARKAIALKVSVLKLLAPAADKIAVVAKELAAKLKQRQKGLETPLTKQEQNDLLMQLFLESDTTLLNDAISSIMDKVDPEKFADLCASVLVGIRHGEQEVTQKNFDVIFMDDMAHMYKCIAAVLMVNFGSLFKLMGIGNPR